MSTRRKSAHEVDQEEETGNASTQIITKRNDVPREVMLSLIADLEQKSFFWNKNHKMYKMTGIEDAHYRDLDKKYNFQLGLAKRIIGYLKQQFASSLEKETLPSGSGCNSPKRRRNEFEFKDQLWFLKDGSTQTNTRVSSVVDIADDDGSINSGDSDDDSLVTTASGEILVKTETDHRPRDHAPPNLTVPPINRELSEGTKQTLAAIGTIGTSATGQPVVTARKRKRKSIDDELEQTNKAIAEVTKAMAAKNNYSTRSDAHADIHIKLDDSLSKIPAVSIDDFKCDLYSAINSLTKKYSLPNNHSFSSPFPPSIPYGIPMPFPPNFPYHNQGFPPQFPPQGYHQFPPAQGFPSSSVPPTTSNQPLGAPPTDTPFSLTKTFEYLS